MTFCLFCIIDGALPGYSSFSTLFSLLSINVHHRTHFLWCKCSDQTSTITYFKYRCWNYNEYQECTFKMNQEKYIKIYQPLHQQWDVMFVCIQVQCALFCTRGAVPCHHSVTWVERNMQQDLTSITLISAVTRISATLLQPSAPPAGQEQHWASAVWLSFSSWDERGLFLQEVLTTLPTKPYINKHNYIPRLVNLYKTNASIKLKFEMQTQLKL